MGSLVISVVTPVYNEAQNIPHFYRELSNVARTLSHEFEVIFVDDGSSDDSVNIIESLKHYKNNPPNCVVKLIELSRNFGKEIATTAGIEATCGDAVIILDSDLQHPISSIPTFIKKWEEGFEVVVGVRSTHAHYNF